MSDAKDAGPEAQRDALLGYLSAILTILRTQAKIAADEFHVAVAHEATAPWLTPFATARLAAWQDVCRQLRREVEPARSPAFTEAFRRVAAGIEEALGEHAPNPSPSSDGS